MKFQDSEQHVNAQQNAVDGMPRCAEASAKQCCLTGVDKANRVQIDCKVFNKEAFPLPKFI